MVNWLVWDGKQHIGINSKVFEHLSGIKITDWKNRTNPKVRYKEIMKMLKGE